MELLSQWGALVLALLSCTVVAKTFQEDSLAVRTILDANGLHSVAVGDVAMKGDNGRIETIGIRNFPSFTVLPASVKQLDQLSGMEISGTGLMELPPEIGDCAALQYMELRGNKLKSLPMEMARLKMIRALGLSRNEFEALPPVIFQLGSLTDLQIVENKITMLPDEICNLKALAHLAAGSNRIHAIPERIGTLTALASINLSNNTLKSLPHSITQLNCFPKACNICFNDGITFSEDQKRWWNVTDYRSYLNTYCVTEIDGRKEQPVGSQQSVLLLSEGNRLSVYTPVSRTIVCTIDDLKGRSRATLIDGTVSTGSHVLLFNREKYAAGVYYIRVTSSSGQVGRKIIITR